MRLFTWLRERWWDFDPPLNVRVFARAVDFAAGLSDPRFLVVTIRTALDRCTPAERAYALRRWPELDAFLRTNEGRR